jgi:hypothetical protein
VTLFHVDLGEGKDAETILQDAHKNLSTTGCRKNAFIAGL